MNNGETYSRTAVLDSIRQALGQEREPHLTSTEIDAEWLALPRDYEQAVGLPHASMAQLFRARLEDYDAHVEQCAEHEVAAALQLRLQESGNPATLVADGFEPAWLPPGIARHGSQTLPIREIEAFGAVLTQASLGIAETGTIVLQTVPGQGRRVETLLPDIHLCVLRVSDLVQRVPEAFARLQATCTLPTTFISGPSATADIEMTRIKGVHGPRFLDVLMVN